MLVVTEAHDTVMAEIGTVGQSLKLEEAACTVRFQFPWAKSRFCQLTEAVELPASTGASVGFVALNVMVAGLTVRVKPAAGMTAAVPGLRGRLGSSGTPDVQSPVAPPLRTTS